MEQIILVDTRDNEIGLMEKMEGHRKGVLHRAFSVLIYNSKGEMLIQKRAKGKYHSGGLWSNACCSHPRPGEPMDGAVSRRLMEELNINLKPHFSHKFIYKIKFSNDLIEHEYDHVYVGTYEGEPTINKDEIEDWKYINRDELKRDIEKNPSHYSHWFKLILSHKMVEV